MPPPPNLTELLATRIYPGMSARESRILRSWMGRHGAEWDSLDVEGRLGAGALLPPHYSEKERADWYKRTRARPDCICKRAPNQALIIEAKEYATSESVWQVLSYVTLYKAEFPGDRVSALIVCEAAHPTATQLATNQQVAILQYDLPPDLPAAPGTEAGAV